MTDKRLRAPSLEAPVLKRPAQQLADDLTPKVSEEKAATQQEHSMKQHFNQLQGKTAKRKAVEAALASKHSAGEEQQEPESAKRRRTVLPAALRVPACVPACKCEMQCIETNASASALAAWCEFEVSLPNTKWRSLVDSMNRLQASSQAVPNNAELTVDGVRIIIVENKHQLKAALQALRASMTDSVIAIDLEWKPIFTPNDCSRVAMIQLATSSVAVLIRICCLRFKLPSLLKKLLRDPEIVVLGYAWNGCDEKNMQKTFKMGRRSISKFLDLQLLSHDLGYYNTGLGTLAQQVLGVAIPKAHKVAMSNWEAPQITSRQVFYAALDVLIAGEIFRALRLWHSSPPDCNACKLPLGVAPPTLKPKCKEPHCRKLFANTWNLLCHAEAKTHSCEITKCTSCGRVHKLH